MKTLYLHVGTPKTGTSAIQRFCKDNSELLEKKGYCFRTMPFYYSDHSSKVRNAHFLIGNIVDENGDFDISEKENRIRQGLALVAEWFREMDHVILSEENIWNYLRGSHWSILENLKEFCREQGAELKIIVYLRRQDDYLSSWWKQRIRTGGRMDEWEEVMEHPPKRMILNYYKHLKKIENIVGRENLIVRRYEKGNFKGENHTIFSDFLEAIGLKFTEEFVIEKGTVNSSMTNNYAEIKRILNRLQEDGARINNDVSRYFEKTAIVCSAFDTYTQQYSLFSQEEQEAFLKRYENVNQKILAEYFPEEDVLFQSGLTKLPKWERDNPQTYEDTVLYFGKLALTQKERIDRLEAELKETKQELSLVRKEYGAELKALKILLAPVKRVWKLFQRKKNAE